MPEARLRDAPRAHGATRRSLAGDWCSSLAGQTLQLVAYAATSVLLARHLGVRAFGVWASLTALSGLTVNVAGIGFGNLLVRDTARDLNAFPVSWGNALLVTFVSGSALALLASLTAWVVLPPAVPAAAVTAAFVSDLVFSRLVVLTATACQGLGRIRAMVRITATLQVLRLGAVLAWMIATPRASLVSWALMNGAASVVACAVVLGWAFLRLPRPAISLARVCDEWRKGAYFAASPYTQALNNDADKVILGRVGALDALGAYGAAYRVLSVAFVPVQALLTVTYPAFFERGRHGLGSSAYFARSLAPWALGCAGVASLVVLIGAPALPLLLGSGYEESVHVLRWLCVLPLLKAMQFLCGDAMTGADLQRQRTAIQAGVAAANVVLNLLLDPALGWRGAAIATLASDGLLAGALYVGALGHRATVSEVAVIDTAGV